MNLQPSSLDATILKEYFSNSTSIIPDTSLEPDTIDEESIPCTLQKPLKFIINPIISQIDYHAYFYHSNNEFLTPSCYEQRKFLNQNLTNSKISTEFETAAKKQKLDDESNKSLTKSREIKKPISCVPAKTLKSIDIVIDSELDVVRTQTKKTQSEWNVDSFFNRSPIRSKKVSPNSIPKSEPKKPFEINKFLIENVKDPVEGRSDSTTTQQPKPLNQDTCFEPNISIVDSQLGNSSKVIDDYELCLEQRLFNRAPIRSTRKTSSTATKNSKPFEINNFLSEKVVNDTIEESLNDSTGNISVNINLQTKSTNQDSCSNPKISGLDNQSEKDSKTAEGCDYESCLDNFFNRKVIRVTRSDHLNGKKSSSADKKE